MVRILNVILKRREDEGIHFANLTAILTQAFWFVWEFGTLHRCTDNGHLNGSHHSNLPDSTRGILVHRRRTGGGTCDS